MNTKERYIVTKRNTAMKKILSCLLAFTLIVSAIAVMPMEVSAATKYVKSVSKTLSSKRKNDAKIYVIPLEMKKDAKITVTIQNVKGCENAVVYAFQYISDYTRFTQKGECAFSDWVNSGNKKSTIAIKAKKGKKSGLVVMVYGKTKVTVKCQKAYVKLGKVQDWTNKIG